MNIYLDVNGVLIEHNKNSAYFVAEFLKYITNYHEVFWLTTWCKGNETKVLLSFSSRLSPETMSCAAKIKPTNWQTYKTEAIDFTKDFRWLEDQIFFNELEDLKDH